MPHKFHLYLIDIVGRLHGHSVSCDYCIDDTCNMAKQCTACKVISQYDACKVILRAKQVDEPAETELVHVVDGGQVVPGKVQLHCKLSQVLKKN